MKEIPILFSTPMVQAILDGRKTMTRRIINPQAPEECKFIGSTYSSKKNKIGFYWSDNTEGDMQGFWPSTFENLYCKFGQPGDLLWVRETWMHNLNINHFPNDPFYYKASLSKQFIEEWPGYFKPSIHMPKAAARIWLQVEEIKVERLQDITEEDALAEGVQREGDRFYNYYQPGIVIGKGGFIQAKTSFNSLWNEINGEESWDLNPWVWVVKFKVLSTTGKPETITL